MANKPIQFFIRLRKMTIGLLKDKVVQIAQITGRKRVDFRNFCVQVAKNTTFSPQEVGAIINLAIYTARDLVANGDTVEFGDMGTLMPSFRSKAVEQGQKFNANEHILKPTVKLILSKKYFELTGVSFERVPEPAKKTKAGTTPKP